MEYFFFISLCDPYHIFFIENDLLSVK